MRWMPRADRMSHAPCADGTQHLRGAGWMTPVLTHGRTGHVLRTLVAVAAVLLPPAMARAELYSFVDSQGVVHFTNLPDDPRAKARAVRAARNTFLWSDELGALRKIHRVDVTDYDDIIIGAARYYSLPPALVKAIVAVESSFEAGAVSPAGAQGLMQLVPETASEVSVRDPFDARDSIYGGARYLRLLANRFNGDLRLTIAAYNAGPVVVEGAGEVPPIDETRRYVQRVLVLYMHYLTSWQAPPQTRAQPQPKPQTQPEPTQP